MTGPEPVDLPGAMPTDSMMQEPEYNSLNVDDVNIVSDLRIGECICNLNHYTGF